MGKNAKWALISILVLLPLVLKAQEIVWQQEYQARYNGKLTCAYSGGFSSAKPALVDIDADGDLDMFIGEDSYSNNLTFIQNDGTANNPYWVFKTGNYADATGFSLAPAFCDIDADGDYDLFYGGWNGQIRFCRNDGTAYFPLWTKVTETFANISIDIHTFPTFCDIDNDSDLDMFVGNGNGKIHFYRNEGTAQSHQFVLADSQYLNIDENRRVAATFVDIDNDSDFDLFVGSEQFILFYRNTGTPSAPVWVQESDRYEQHFGRNCLMTAFPDLDNDGDFDMLVADEHLDLSWYENTGTAETPSWNLITNYYATIDIGYTTFPAFADLDNDGDLEIYAGGHSNGGLFQLLNEGTAQEPAWICTGDQLVTSGMAPYFCDIDNDGDKDIFAGGYNTFMFFENQGTADAPNMADPIMDYNSIKLPDFSFPALCDIDNDQDFDLFIGREDGGISYYQNTGNASSPVWAEQDTFYQDINTGSIRSTPEFCDIDEDGDFDLFIGTYYGTVFYYQNNGSPTVPVFELVTQRYADIQVDGHVRPVFADIDNDDDPDLFLGIHDGGILFWRNMGMDTAVDECLPQLGTVQGFALEQNYPNPFNPSTTIAYEIPGPCFVKLAIYNIHGQKIKTLVNEHQARGRHEIKWSAKTDTELKITSGLYFYKINAGQFQKTGRMLLLK